MPDLDAATTVDALKQAVLAFAQERDWLQFHSPENLSIAISIEAAELMEPFRWLTTEESGAALREPALARSVAAELADVMLLVLQFANVTGIDLSTAVREKLLENAQKYPVDKAKGSARKYDRL